MIGFAIISISVILFTINIIKTQEASAPVDNSKYTILAYNDLGMHCMQSDYSSFMILPPGNNIKVQVFRKGIKEAKLINKGIIIEYKVNNNTSSADKVNFWKYAKDYGFDIKPDQGITGNYLSGICKLSENKLFYEATAIPVVPYNDGSNVLNPYQTLSITVKDASKNQVLAVQETVVVPVSTEMPCSNCHGTENTDQNILRAHDENSGTKLYIDLKDGIKHRCSECHQDNALAASGKEGIPSLSLAMHGFHAPKMFMSSLNNPCYNCHPGNITKCSRGVMAANGLTCGDAKCHGSMENVAKSQVEGRNAWLDEPDCVNCHGDKYASNKNILYRNSYLENGPEEMNNEILCASCHNSPHSEWPSTLEIDNAIPIKIYGKPDFIQECAACHQGSGKLHGYEGAE